MNLDFWLRAMTILVFIIVRVYWYKAKYKSNLEKHKTQNKSLTIEKVTIQLLGFILVILGSMEAILGRLALGNNWTESYEYQIKKKHELVIHGLYKYVRHPIYGGFMIAVTGAFIVAKTYLFIPLFF